MNIRCKAQEEKLTKLKVYKQFYNNSSGFKCLLCSKLISNHLFLKHISKCAEIIKTNNNSINLSKSNHSFSNIDSHKKNQVDYKNSLIKQNAKKHQSIHYDNEFNQRLTHEVSIEELREIQIELDQYINHDQKSSSEFLLSCFYHDFEWKIKKKYINFCELYQQISLAFPGLQLPDSCNIFNNQQIVNYEGDNILNEKKFALQNFIQDLSKIDFIRNSNYFRNFLEVQENLINYLKKEKNGALKNFQNFHGTKNSHFNCIISIFILLILMYH